MCQLIRVEIGDMLEYIFIDRNRGVDDERGSRLDAFCDVNTDLFQTGIETDDAVRTIDIALYLNRIISNAPVGIDRSAFPFLLL